jgi:cell wall assembly regulator SMI1
MEHPLVPTAMTRLLASLDERAPRTRASLLPPADPAALATIARDFRCVLPPSFVDLYGASGGQRLSTPAGIFRGYYFLPLDGVDSVTDELDTMLEAVDAGVPWAAKDRYPFAKDFGGNSLCVEQGGQVLSIEEGEVTVLAESLGQYLDELAAQLEAGLVVIDDTVEKTETFAVVFDAGRQRAPGDRVTHSVFTQLEIDAVVEDVGELLRSPLRKEPPAEHGFAVRLVPRDPAVRPKGAPSLVDGRGRPLRAVAGQASGGGRPGFAFYVSTERPIPEGSRLHVELERVLKE